jgi:hypothetical protein
MRLTFTEVKAMVCLSQETYQKLRHPIFARVTAPAFKSRDERARLRPA